MGDQERSFSVSLIIPTRSRFEALASRIPVWTSAGFDEVLIVDGTNDRATREKTRALCEQYGATWIEAPVRLGDTRSFQRNLGARAARGTWIHFQDDDDDAIALLNRNVLRKATEGRDWLVGPKGVHIVLHRREAFLAAGGYPEDMVAAEDGIMSIKVRRHGIGGMVNGLYDRIMTFPPARADPLSRLRNAFFYGYTSLLLMLRYPRRKDIVLGEARRVLNEIRHAPGTPHRLIYAAVRMFGIAVSPVHCLRVLLRSGPRALRRETDADWQGLR